MPTYKVKWEIELDADSPQAAADQALEIQRDWMSIATNFSVIEASGRVVEKNHGDIEAKAHERPYILITGSPIDGLFFHGPYATAEEANRDGEDVADTEWWATQLTNIQE